MHAGQLSVKAIFDEAAEIADDGARRDYLDRACAGDDAVRLEVDALLRAYADAGSFLQQPAADAGLTDAFTPDAAPHAPAQSRPIGEGPGTRIGPYKLLQPLGEGGMGAVYMAEQERPVRRRVALKIIKPGMDSQQVTARFEAERQALALMDHQNIARVLDAGTTETGRPYFVMELVHGVPITKYCDDAQLNPRERLELFVPVCRAIQHAHQKGIIHRDIKPSNVLVTMYDGNPVAKVIDFGVAKAVDQRLTERTMFTQYGSIIGTLEYMSPEQAEMSALGVDTRSDVYALGVLLYELLTGTTPLERMSLREAGYAEILRRIKEEEPPRPSTRLSASRVALPSISAQRKTEPAKLARLMRGELDWIAMKCLEKDRTRRYETAIGLAQDVERYLRDEPVEACPPSAGYRLRKFARKHRTPIAVAAGFLVLLVADVIFSTWQAARARRAEERATVEAIRAMDAEREATAQRDVATAGRREAEASREALRRSLYASDIQLAQAAWNSGSILRMRELLDGHKPRRGEADLRGFEWNYLRRLGSGFRMLQPFPAAGAGWLSRDGRRLAFSEYVPARSREVGQEFRLRLWDTTSGKELRGFTPFPSASDVSPLLPGLDAGFSPDGHRFAFRAGVRDAAGRWSGRLKIWDWDTGRELLRWPGSADFPVDPRSLVGPTFDATGRRFAAAVPRPGVEGQFDLKVWEVEEGKSLWTIPIAVIDGRMTYYRCLEFSPDGAHIAALVLPGGPQAHPDSREVRILEAATGKELRRFATGTGSLLAYSPDGSRLAVARGGPIGVWDARSGKELLRLRKEQGEFDDSFEWIAFSPDGSRLARASTDGKLRIWDVAPLQPGGDRAPSRILEESGGPLGGIAWGTDGRSIAASDWGGRYLSWDVTTPETRDPMRGPVDSRFSPTSSEDPPRFCAGFRDASASSQEIELRVWDQAGKILFRVKDAALMTPRQVAMFRRTLKLSRDGTRLAYCSMNPGAIRVWEIDTGRELFRRDGEGTFEGGGNYYDGIAFSPDGRRLASIWVGNRDSDGTRHSFACAWDLDWGKEELRIKARSTTLDSGLAFSPDGRRLAATLQCNRQEAVESELRVWDTATGELIMSRAWPSLSISAPCYSANGTLLTTAVTDSYGPSVVKVLDAVSGVERLSLAGHRYQVVFGLAFSPDGRRLASAGGGRDKAEVKLWDVAGGRELLTLPAIGHGNLVFHPEGSRLTYVSATRGFGDVEAKVQVWDATPMPGEPAAGSRHLP